MAAPSPARPHARGMTLRATVVTTLAVLRRHPGRLAWLGALLAGLPTVLSDLVDADGLGAGSASADPGVGTFAARLVAALAKAALLALVTPLVTDRRGTRWHAGLPAAFALSIVTSIGVTLGAVLLVVPGVLLSLRWLVAIPVRMAEGPGLSRALARSAALMRGSYGRCFALLAAYLVATAGSALLVSLVDGAGGSVTTTPGAIAVEAALTTGLDVVAAVATAVVYQQQRDAEGDGPCDQLG